MKIKFKFPIKIGNSKVRFNQLKKLDCLTAHAPYFIKEKDNLCCMLRKRKR